MKGLTILLESLGIKIKPDEIESAFQQGKVLLPRIAQAFQQLDERQKILESKIDELLARQKLMEGFLVDSDVVEKARAEMKQDLEVSRVA